MYTPSLPQHLLEVALESMITLKGIPTVVTTASASMNYGDITAYQLHQQLHVQQHTAIRLSYLVIIMIASLANQLDIMVFCYFNV